jgi:hypothetical protein
MWCDVGFANGEAYALFLSSIEQALGEFLRMVGFSVFYSCEIL